MSAADPPDPPPLAGIEVIELATMIAVPAATHLLATQGADVVKVEHPTAGDELRRYGSQKGGMGGWFANANAGKRSIALDLTSADGADAMWKLLERADVFVVGFRPGVVERLGFTWEEAARRNPGLIWVASSGFGPTGPYADRPAYDPIIQSLAGIAADPTGGSPRLLPAMIADKAAALTTAQAISAALVGRGATGRGRRIDLSMLDAAIAYAWPDQMMHATVLDEDATHLPNPLAGYRLYECTDGWISLAAATDSQWRAFCGAVDRPDLVDDERWATGAGRSRDMNGYYGTLAELIAPFAVGEAVDRLVAAGVPVAPVLDPTEVADDEHVRAVGAVVEIDHPVVGRMRTPQQAARFVDVATLRPAPTHGEHTAEILAELGLDAPGP